MTEINNMQVEKANDQNAVMPLYNLTEYSHNYLETSGSLYQFCRDEPDNVTQNLNNFKFKAKYLDNTLQASIINVKKAVPSKYFSNSWRSLGIPLIVKLILF